MRLDRAIKLICIICLSMTVGALIVARNSPAIAYEPSIYTATPLIVWLVLFINLVCGTGIVIHQVSSERHTKDNLWLLGILLVLLSYTIIISLWIIRGYALWCIGDPAVHLGLIQDIICSGHIGRGNFYPIIHIYAAVISSICGISPIMPHKYIPVIFALLYVAFMYLLAKSVLPDKGQVMLALIASTTLYACVSPNFTPNVEATLVLPLAFFLLIKCFSPGMIQWNILFIIMIFLFPVFHPVPSFALFATLLTIWLGNRIWNAIQWKYVRAISTGFKFTITISLLLLVWSISWFSEFGIWASTIRNLKMAVLVRGGGYITDIVEKAQYAGGYGYSFTQYFFRIYAGVLIYMIITLLTIPILIKKLRFQSDLLKLIYLYGPIAIFALSILMFLFLRVGFGPQRLVVYIVILCMPFVGFGLYEFLKQVHYFRTNFFFPKSIIFFIVVVLVALSVHSAAILYTSPYIYMDNWQITRTEIAGMDHFIHNKDTSIDTTGMSIMPGQFALFLLTQDELVGRQDILTPRGMIREELRPPWHFGYDNYSTLGRLYAKNTYMVLTSRDKSIYRDIHPRMAEIRFTPQDFERLKKDSTIDYIYSNGGLDTYFISSTNSL